MGRPRSVLPRPNKQVAPRNRRHGGRGATTKVPRTARYVAGTKPRYFRGLSARLQLDWRIWDFIRSEDFLGATETECAAALGQPLERIADRVRQMVKVKLLIISTIRRDKATVYFVHATRDFEKYAAETRVGAGLKASLTLVDNEILAAGRRFLIDWRKAIVVGRRKVASQRAVLRLVRSLQKLA
jgi:hypothetical protein